MKNKNKGSIYFFRTLGLLFLLFISLYIAMESGYYENRLGEKVTVTNEKIKEFEEDVKEGKDVDVNDYLKEDYVDYSNKVSRAGMSLSNSTEKFMTSGIQKLFKFIGALFS